MVDTSTLTDRKEMFRSMLADAVAVLCRNTMPYNTELSIEGLIGITADKKDIVLVSINEIIDQAGQKAPAVSPKDNGNSSMKTKSRKRKKMKASPEPPEPESSRKLSKLEDDTIIVSQLSSLKDILHTEGDAIVKQELQEKGPAYGGYRNELYNTNDHELVKTTTPSFTCSNTQLEPVVDTSVQPDFSSPQAFALGDPSSLPAAQQYAELLLERVDDTGNVVFQCTICQKTIKSKGNFGRHIKGHVNSAAFHPCDICGKSFGRKDNLRRHMNLVHQVDTPSSKASNSNNAAADEEESNNTTDILPGLSDSITGALGLNDNKIGAQETSKESENIHLKAFPQIEDHAQKYFQNSQQATTSPDFGLGNSSFSGVGGQELLNKPMFPPLETAQKYFPAGNSELTSN